jgi:ATP-dependent protease Clp ATPase subunit
MQQQQDEVEIEKNIIMVGQTGTGKHWLQNHCKMLDS